MDLPTTENFNDPPAMANSRPMEGPVYTAPFAAQLNLMPTPTTTEKPKVTKALPTVRDHTTSVVSANRNEYLPREIDRDGDAKLDENGYLQGGRSYRCRTFLLPGRGESLFMLATTCAKDLGYRDSYLLFNKNRSLYKINASQEEKDYLIRREILPQAFRSRPVSVVTARSMFRQFGSRMVKNGYRVVDDYWQAKAITQGFTSNDPAGTKRPRDYVSKATAASPASHRRRSEARLRRGSATSNARGGSDGNITLPTSLPAEHVPLLIDSSPAPTIVEPTSVPDSNYYQQMNNPRWGNQPFPETYPMPSDLFHPQYQRPVPRHEITGPPYQDTSKPMSLVDAATSNQAVAEYNASISQQRYARTNYLQHFYEQTHEQPSSVLNPPHQPAPHHPSLYPGVHDHIPRQNLHQSPSYLPQAPANNQFPFSGYPQQVPIASYGNRHGLADISPLGMQTLLSYAPLPPYQMQIPLDSNHPRAPPVVRMPPNPPQPNLYRSPQSLWQSSTASQPLPTAATPHANTYDFMKFVDPRLIGGPSSNDTLAISSSENPLFTHPPTKDVSAGEKIIPGSNPLFSFASTKGIESAASLTSVSGLNTSHTVLNLPFVFPQDKGKNNVTDTESVGDALDGMDFIVPFSFEDDMTNPSTEDVLNQITEQQETEAPRDDGTIEALFPFDRNKENHTGMAETGNRNVAKSGLAKSFGNEATGIPIPTSTTEPCNSPRTLYSTGLEGHSDRLSSMGLRVRSHHRKSSSSSSMYQHVGSSTTVPSWPASPMTPSPFAPTMRPLGTKEGLSGGHSGPLLASPDDRIFASSFSPNIRPLSFAASPLMSASPQLFSLDSDKSLFATARHASPPTFPQNDLMDSAFSHGSPLSHKPSSESQAQSHGATVGQSLPNVESLNSSSLATSYHEPLSSSLTTDLDVPAQPLDDNNAYAKAVFYLAMEKQFSEPFTADTVASLGKAANHGRNVYCFLSSIDTRMAVGSQGVPGGHSNAAVVTSTAIHPIVAPATTSLTLSDAWGGTASMGAYASPLTIMTSMPPTLVNPGIVGTADPLIYDGFNGFSGLRKRAMESGGSDEKDKSEDVQMGDEPDLEETMEACWEKAITG